MLHIRNICYFFILFYISFPVLAQQEINLEKIFSSNIVIESKQIKIPHYPFAFNPSIIKWQNSFLMSFRHIPNEKDSFTCYIGLIWLDDDFNPIGHPQFLNPRSPSSSVSFRSDDARLLVVNNQLYIVYSDNEDIKISKGGFRVYVAEITNKNGFFEMNQIEKLSIFEDENKNLREKNWVAFEYEKKLLLAYSIVPHKILKPYLNGNNSCETISSTNNNFSSWNWGIPRGGTPGILIGDKYLSFFHSSIEMQTVHTENKKSWHYFMGAYTHEGKPPFSITHVSPIPIVGENFYNGPEYKPYWKPVKVVFPCGFIHDNNYIWVFYGKDDHESWVAKLDREQLFKSLVPVNE